MALKLCFQNYMKNALEHELEIMQASVTLYDLVFKFLCVKSIQIRSFFWSVFFFIRTRNNSVFEQLSRSV